MAFTDFSSYIGIYFIQYKSVIFPGKIKMLLRFATVVHLKGKFIYHFPTPTKDCSVRLLSV